MPLRYEFDPAEVETYLGVTDGFSPLRLADDRRQ
jgi:hypothetical protein